MKKSATGSKGQPIDIGISESHRRQIADGTTLPEWKPGAQWKVLRDETMKKAKTAGAR